jgi:predicted transcriptional regulator
VSLDESDRLNIIRLILEAANEAVHDDHNKKMTTTIKIMYTALFNHPQLKGYWKLLTQNGMLSYDFDTETWKTTEKGQKLLKAYSEMDDDDRSMIKGSSSPPSTQPPPPPPPPF